jgi:ABC-type multidrug transport system fused ATPase/permease subunit
MRELPLADPGTPDLRSPARLLLWIARGQLGALAAGAVFGVVWMGAQAVTPALVGRAIDAGVAGRDTGALLRWSGLVLAAGVVGAVAGVLRHRVAVANWLTATYRVQQLLARHAVRLGGSLPRRVSTGEVVSVGSQDVERAGRTTVVCTTSPLLLDRADRVALVVDGQVVAEGTHHELLHTEPRYRAVVTRGEQP